MAYTYYPHSFFHEAKRRHHISLGLLAISWLFALISMCTTGWFTVSVKSLGVKYYSASGGLCCYSGVPWWWVFDEGFMIIILIVNSVYLLYLCWRLAQCEHDCPDDLIKHDLAVSAALSLMYIFVIISWPAGISSGHGYWSWTGVSTSVGYSYVLAIIAGLCAFAATGANLFFQKRHSGHINLICIVI